MSSSTKLFYLAAALGGASVGALLGVYITNRIMENDHEECGIEEPGGKDDRYFQQTIRKEGYEPEPTDYSMFFKNKPDIHEVVADMEKEEDTEGIVTVNGLPLEHDVVFEDGAKSDWVIVSEDELRMDDVVVEHYSYDPNLDMVYDRGGAPVVGAIDNDIFGPDALTSFDENDTVCVYNEVIGMVRVVYQIDADASPVKAKTGVEDRKGGGVYDPDASKRFTNDVS